MSQLDKIIVCSTPFKVGFDPLELDRIVKSGLFGVKQSKLLQVHMYNFTTNFTDSQTSSLNRTKYIVL